MVGDADCGDVAIQGNPLMLLSVTFVGVLGGHFNVLSTNIAVWDKRQWHNGGRQRLPADEKGHPGAINGEVAAYIAHGHGTVNRRAEAAGRDAASFGAISRQ